METGTHDDTAEVKLGGHLTAPDLVVALERIEPRLADRATAILVDCRSMTGYDRAARDYFADWNRTNKARISRVAIVIRNPVWLMVVSAMSLVANQNMRAFRSYDDAVVWAQQG